MTPPSRATPYQGLVPYDEQDAPFFFGRDTEIELVTANLISQRFTLLYGPSGVGKSSVLRAGVAPQLRERAHQNLVESGSPEFAIVIFSSWRDDPVQALVARVDDEITRTLGTDVETLRRNVSTNNPQSLADALAANARRAGGDLLLILDQFEEYFLYHGNEDGEGTFAVELPLVLTRPDVRVNVLISIREDALATLDRFEGRIPNLFKNYLRVEHLDRSAARDAIVKPLLQYNALTGGSVSIEPALVNAVLDQVKTGQVFLGEAGQGMVRAGERDEANRETRIETPYLQLVMTRLWSETFVSDETVGAGSSRPASGGENLAPALRLETLQRLGGAANIVRTHLDTTMNALTPQEQEVSARIFRYLVTPSGTKIAHTAQDLSDYAGMTPSELNPTLEKLSSGDIRILRPVAPPLDRPDQPRYEIFHDVLGAPILDWRARYAQQQGKIESDKKLAAEKGRVRRLRFGLLGLSLLLLAVIALALYAFTQREAAARASAEAETQKAAALNQKDAAEQARNEALAQRDAAEKAQAEARAQQKIARAGELAALSLGQLANDPERALLMAREAVNTANTAQTEDALRTALLDPNRFTFRGKGSWVTDARITGDSKYAVTLEPCSESTLSACGSVRVWDIQTGALMTDLPLETDAQAMDLSPDGRYLVTAHPDDVARVWEIPSGHLVSELRGHGDKINSVQFSPDGKQIVTTSDDKTVRVWDTTTGSLVRELGGYKFPVDVAKFSPNGAYIGTLGQGTVAYGTGTRTDIARIVDVWDVNRGTRVLQIPNTNNSDLTFSPDSQFFALWGELAPTVWSVATGNKIAEFTDVHNGVRSLVLSPNGKFILTGNQDGTLRVYDALTGLNQAILLAHGKGVNDAEFSPNGQFVASVGDDNRASLWHFTEGDPHTRAAVQRLQDLNGHTARINSTTFSPDGQSILTASNDGTARLWHVNTGLPLVGHKDFVTAAAYSPDGKQIATASKDGSARIWDAQTHQTVHELRGHAGAIRSIAYSSDSSKILTSSDDKTAHVWDTATGQTVFTIGDASNTVTAPAFSPDGKQIAAGSIITESGTLKNRVTIWDLQTKSVVGQADTNCGKNEIRTVSWSPDSKAVVVACDNPALVLIAAANRDAQLLSAPNPLTQLSGPLFSPDGKRIAAAGTSNNVLVWDLTTNPPQRIALDGYFQSSGDLAFSPDGKYLVTTGGEEIPRLWDVNSGKLLRELKGHTETVSRAAFSPDGRFIVTASNDKTARLWETATGKLVETLYGHGDILRDVAFSPDGKTILTAGDNTARLYECIECGTPQELLQLANARITRELTCEERVTFLHETIECP